MIFFLDDLNLPQVDKYDTQSAIELARQYLNYQHWFDPFNPAKGFKTIQNKSWLLLFLNCFKKLSKIEKRVFKQFQKIDVFELFQKIVRTWVFEKHIVLFKRI